MLAWKWFYDRYEETRGRGNGQNPGCAPCVSSDTLHVVGMIVGRARVVMLAPMEPWMVKRILRTLRADDAHDCTVALMGDQKK